jgi:hypothetical protein
VIQRCKKDHKPEKRGNEKDSPEKERRARRTRTKVAEQRARKKGKMK